MSHDFSMLILAISAFLFLAYFMGTMLSKLKQPKVVAEILVGVCLGPSLLGLFFPNIFQEVFNSNSLQSLGALKELGLILLMFCSGYEIKNLNLRNNFKTTLWAVVLGIGIPAVFATVLFNQMDLSSLMGTQNSLEKLKMVLALSAAVTSIPVIARILMDLNLIQTPFAQMILSIAIVEDLILYATLNATLILSETEIHNGLWSSIGKHILITSVFLGVIIFGRDKIYQFARLTAFRKANLEKHQYVALIFASLLLFVFVLGHFGVVSMISSFACGLIVASADTEKAQETGETIRSFSFATFIPIYFIMVGLKINLHQDFSLGWLVFFLVFSSILKITGGFLAGKFSGFENLKAAILGVTLNARGGPGIVIASVSLDAGIISGKLFVTLILTALITSSAAGVFLKSFRQKVLEY